MTTTEFWVSPTSRRRDGIPVGTAADAEYLKHRHGLNVFAITGASDE